jgi:hypothetical protein
MTPSTRPRSFSVALLGLVLTAWAAVTARARDERGDVPGWVMITVMTAGLVAALTAVAGPQLRDMLTSALNSVGG